MEERTSKDATIGERSPNHPVTVAFFPEPPVLGIFKTPTRKSVPIPVFAQSLTPSIPMHTITVRAGKGEMPLFSRLTAQRMLKISHRGKWRSHLRAVGIDPDSNPQLTWTDIKNLLALQLFLRARNGVHSVYQFSRIFREGLMETAIARFQIDLDTEFRRLKNDYDQ